MCGKTWSSEVWKAIAGRTSLLSVSLMQGHEWKHQERKEGTRCCTQLATLHRIDTVSSWRFL